MALLDAHTEHTVVHTGQNYDYELNGVFFDSMGIRKPDRFLEVDTSSLGTVLGETLIKSEQVLIEKQPDAFLVLGDTNSSIAALIAKRRHIPVFHMEAGNRCFDFNVPEETNRRLVDHIADFNLVYTEHARRHLLSEGCAHRRILLTGSPMREVLEFHEKGIAESVILKDLDVRPKEYLVVSVHREENVDGEKNLVSILNTLSALENRYNLPIIVSTHPRTRKRLDMLRSKPELPKVQWCKPFGFFDYVRLQKDAFCTVSDSGTISEESAILNFPGVTIRNAIERPEALDTGSIILAGVDPLSVLRSVDVAVAEARERTEWSIPEGYTIRDTSWRVLKALTGLSQLSNRWHGIENPSL